MRHMVGRLLVPSRPAQQSRVPAGVEEGPELASSDGWRKAAKDAAHLPHGRSRSPLHCLKALDERFKMGRKRTDGCSRRRHESWEGPACCELARVASTSPTDTILLDALYSYSQGFDFHWLLF
jgi:hypothetical protein